MSLPRYPNYKDSGVEWLGEVPGHWEVWKLAQAFEVIGSGTTPKSDNRNYYDDGNIAWLNTGDLNDGELDSCEKRITSLALADYSSLKTFPAGSLVIAMYGATIGKLAILQFPATVNQACCVFAGQSPVETKFMFYWFLGLRQQIISLATGGGQPNVSQEILRSLRVACPSQVEQTQIAAFLDRETAKIDELVAEQRRLMELLKEKRQAVISHAVTRGLNPDAPLKPSGIEWLGDVPEHWGVQRYKNALTIFQGMAFKSSDYVDYSATVSIRMGNIKKGGFINLEHNSKYLPDSFSESYSEYALKENDLIIAMTDMSPSLEFLAVPAIMKGLDPSCIYLLNQRVGKLTVNGSFHTEYVKYLLLSDGLRDQLKFLGLGTVQSNMSSEDLYCAYLTAPPMEEQVAIAAALDLAARNLDTLTTEAQRAIDLLQERRTALISAAVTGQIDVRGLVAA